MSKIYLKLTELDILPVLFSYFLFNNKSQYVDHLLCVFLQMHFYWYQMHMQTELPCFHQHNHSRAFIFSIFSLC